MHVVTVEHMVAAEKRAIADGLPELALLESAGKSVAQAAWNSGLSPGDRVAVLCGVGNNAGDGLVAARYLVNRTVDVHIVLTRSLDEMPLALRRYVDMLVPLGVAVHQLSERDEAIDAIQTILAKSDLIIDALLGTGAQGEPRGTAGLAVDLANVAQKKVLAIDVPTGVMADTGHVHRRVLRADTTVAMSAPKMGHLLLPGSEQCGRLVIADVGIPHQYIEQNARAQWIRAHAVSGWFPPRPLDSHKGSFGTTLVIAGSRSMPGAATLTLQASLRSGAGLTAWAGPSTILPIVASLAPEAVFIPLDEVEGAVSPDSVATLAGRVQMDHSVAIGPGIGLERSTYEFVTRLLATASTPIVVDADGLTHLAQIGEWPGQPDSVRVLTPHPKEMARLLGTDVTAVQQDRVAAAREAARKYGAVVLLKGYPTLVATPDGHLGIVPAGNPVLSVGGTGDVLTGLIAGLLAQGLDPWRAAVLGAVWHGLAADRLAMNGENAGHTPGDLLKELAAARAEIMSLGSTPTRDSW